MCFGAKEKVGTAQVGRDYQGMVCVSEQKRKFEQQKWVEIIRVCFVFQSERKVGTAEEG